MFRCLELHRQPVCSSSASSGPPCWEEELLLLPFLWAEALMSLWKKLSGMEMAAVLAAFPPSCDPWPKQLKEGRASFRLTGCGYNPLWLLECRATSAPGGRGDVGCSAGFPFLHSLQAQPMEWWVMVKMGLPPPLAHLTLPHGLAQHLCLNLIGLI